VLSRDGGRCRVCGEVARLVHHRRPGISADRWLITLCRRCHARVHHRARLSYGLPALFVTLWREQFPRVPLQFELALSRGQSPPCENLALFAA
jgi:5-methylcytosine-specific restriction endonuclease McrA